MDVLGMPLLDLPDWLVEDLLIWRRSASIMQYQLDEAERKKLLKDKNSYGY